MGDGPLAGMLVADFSRVLAGPLAAATLGDLGATVVKVERPGQGDDTRAWGPPFLDGESAYYLAMNRNKRSVALDLDDPSDRAAAAELARRADVLVENFRPGSLDRLGLGYDDVRAGNPAVVYASLTGFGRAGQAASLPGYDLLVQATGGLMSLTGDPAGEPTKVGVALVDVLAGLNLQVAILAALHHRQRTGQGQRVEVSLLDSLLAGLVNQASTFLVTGRSPGRMGNRHPTVAPYEPLPASDRPVVVAVGNDAQFRRLCDALGEPALGTDPRFATNTDRVAHRDALVAALVARLGTDTADAWIAVLQGAGVPCGPVNDVGQAFALAERLGLDPVRRLARAGGGTVPQVASPLRLSASPVRYDLPPPRLGEHTAEVLAWLSREGAGPLDADPAGLLHPDPALADERVLLRPWRETDLAGLSAFADPLVQRFSWPRTSPYTEADARAYLAEQERERRQGTALSVALVEPGDDALVLGGASLHHVDREQATAAVGYWLAPQARGRGVASSAVRLLAQWSFAELGLARLELTCGPDNAASERVAQRCGFVREGLLRSHQPFKGARRDTVVFGLLPGELR